MASRSVIETKKRIDLVKQVDKYIQESSLSGLLVTGSLAWGKNKAVTESSDIDFYLLAPSLESFKISLLDLPNIPQSTKETLKRMLSYNFEHTDTRSIKTSIGPYFGAIYLFTENDLSQLTQELDNSDSKFFKNLRPLAKPQTKEYKGIKGNRFTFTTPISKAKQSDNLWIRTDPIYLAQSGELLRTSMKKNEKSIGQNRKKLQRKSAN